LRPCFSASLPSVKLNNMMINYVMIDDFFR